MSKLKITRGQFMHMAAAAAAGAALAACAGDALKATAVRDRDTPAPAQGETIEAATAPPVTVAPMATDAEADAIVRPEGWSEGTHGKGADPNYDIVFAQDRVHEITIAIAPEDWEAMQADMVALFGEAGSGSEDRGPGGGMPGPEGARPRPGEDEAPEGAVPPEGRGRPVPPQDDGSGGRPGGRGFGGGDMTHARQPKDLPEIEQQPTRSGDRYSSGCAVCP